MTLLLDEKLSWKLADRISDLFQGCPHVAAEIKAFPSDAEAAILILSAS